MNWVARIGLSGCWILPGPRTCLTARSEHYRCHEPDQDKCPARNPKRTLLPHRSLHPSSGNVNGAGFEPAPAVAAETDGHGSPHIR